METGNAMLVKEGQFSMQLDAIWAFKSIVFIYLLEVLLCFDVILQQRKLRLKVFQDMNHSYKCWWWEGSDSQLGL